MTGLIIDTSREQALLALTFKENLLNLKIFTHENQLSQIFFSSLNELLQDTNTTVKNLDYIAIGVGPGSFTGTRIGASIAKSLAFALNIPLVSFCSLYSYLPAPYENSMGILTLTATKQEAYLLKITKENELCELPQRFCFSELPEALTHLEQVILLEKNILPEMLRSWNIDYQLPSPPNPAFLIPHLYQKFLNKKTEPETEVSLIY